MPTPEPPSPNTNITSAHRGQFGAYAVYISPVTGFIMKGNLSGKAGYVQFQSTPICLPNLSVIREVRPLHSWLLLARAADISMSSNKPNPI